MEFKNFYINAGIMKRHKRDVELGEACLGKHFNDIGAKNNIVLGRNIKNPELIWNPSIDCNTALEADLSTQWTINEES